MKIFKGVKPGSIWFFRRLFDEAAGAGGAGGSGNTGQGTGGTSDTGSGAGGAGGAGAGGTGAGAGGTGGTQAAPPTWDALVATLPEEARAAPELAKIKSFDALVGSFRASQKLVGRDPNSVVEIPAAGDEAAQRAVLGKLGLPDTVDKYQLKPIKDVPEGFGLDKPLGQWLTKAAFDAGVLPGAAQKLYEGFVGQMTAAQTAQVEAKAAAVNANVEALVKEWGAEESDNFKQNVAAAQYGVGEIGGDELRQLLRENGLGTHPVILKSFSKAGRLLAEKARGREGDSAAPDFTQTTSKEGGRAAGKDQLATALAEKDPIKRKQLLAAAQKTFDAAFKGTV